MFYTFTQNNSGGFFVGPEYVIIEADNYREANELAELHDIYFNGVDKDRDCACCGDRWYKQYGEYNASIQPTIYGKAVLNENFDLKHPLRNDIVIYMKNGVVIKKGCNKK